MLLGYVERGGIEKMGFNEYCIKTQLEDKLACSFKLAADNWSVRVLCVNSDGPALLKMNLLGFGVDASELKITQRE